jgi:hypothetical protein
MSPQNLPLSIKEKSQCDTLAKPILLTPNRLNFKQCLKLGNLLIIAAFLLSFTCVLVSFIFEQHFSLAIQITAHIGTIVFAAILKLGYVIRCIGAHGLGHEAY